VGGAFAIASSTLQSFALLNNGSVVAWGNPEIADYESMAQISELEGLV
jgi:hypothetical protein